MSDSLVALGGILQTATDAYRKAEDSRIEEVKALKMMLEEKETKFNKAIEDQKAHFEKVLESQKQEMNTLAAEIRGKALLKFTLRDLEGSWFETNSNKRIVCALVHALFRPQTKTHFEDTFLSGRVRERRREDTFRRHIKRRRISPRRRITPRRHISKTH